MPSAQSAPGTGSTIAVAQFAPIDDPEFNLSRVRELAARAADRGARLVVFPEYSSYFSADLGQSFVDAAQAIDGPFVSGLRELATDLGIHVVAGLVERTDEHHRFSNTLVALDDSGDLVSTYRKLHLYDAFGARESDWVRAGDVEDPITFRFDGFTVGLQTCYDLRFPEVTRRLVDAGADLVLIPSEWVRGALKERHWHTLLAARAIENTIYVAAADHTPPIGVGNSVILDPMGVVVASMGETVGVAVGDIDPDRVASVRTINPALELRRFGVVPREIPGRLPPSR